MHDAAQRHGRVPSDAGTNFISFGKTFLTIGRRYWRPRQQASAWPQKSRHQQKKKMAANESAKVEPVRSRAIFLVPIASKHKQAVAPQAAVVCYVHRDGSCKPY